MKTKVLTVYLFVIVSLTAVSCGTQTAKKAEPVRAAYPPIVASLPMYVAENRKSFEAKNVSVSKTVFVNSNDMINALVAKQVDILPAVSLIPIINLEIEYPGRVRLFSHSRMRT